MSKSIPSDLFSTNHEITLPVIDRIGLISSVTGRIKQKRDFERVMIHGRERLKEIGECILEIFAPIGPASVCFKSGRLRAGASTERIATVSNLKEIKKI